MKRILKIAIATALAVWAWRTFFGRREPEERAGVSYADGSDLVLEPGSTGFERLASVARSALRS